MFVVVISYNINKDFIGDNRFILKHHEWIDGAKPLPIVKVMYVNEPNAYTHIDTSVN